jgi:hypothetical protein
VAVLFRGRSKLMVNSESIDGNLIIELLKFIFL